MFVVINSHGIVLQVGGNEKIMPTSAVAFRAQGSTRARRCAARVATQRVETNTAANANGEKVMPDDA